MTAPGSDGGVPNPFIDFIEYLKTVSPEEAQQALRRAAMMAAPSDKALAEAEAKIVQTFGDYWDAEEPEVPVLVEPRLLVRGTVVVTAGRAGKGKTQLSLNRCMRWACGLPLFDTLPHVMVPADHKPLKILIIENEGSGGMFWHQTKTMYENADFAGKEQIRDNLLIWGDGGYSGLKLDNEDHVRWIMSAGIEKHSPDIVYLEPWRGLHRANENDSTEMSRVLDVAEQMATDAQICIHIAHHETKSWDEGQDLMNRLRGSGAFEGTCATIEHHMAVNADRFRELNWSKVRYGPKPAPVRMQWNAERWWYEHVEESAVAVAIHALLINSEDPLTVAELAEESGESQSRVRKALEELTEEGQIKPTRNPHGQGRAYRPVASREDTEPEGALGV